MAIATSPLDIRVNGAARGSDASAATTSGTVDLARSVIALDADDLVRPVGAVEHRDRAGEPEPAEVLFPEFAEPDPRLAYKAAAGKMNP